MIDIESEIHIHLFVTNVDFHINIKVIIRISLAFLSALLAIIIQYMLLPMNPLFIMLIYPLPRPINLWQPTGHRSELIQCECFYVQK